MNHGTKTIASISIAALLMISASACSSSNNNTPPVPSPTSTVANSPRAESGTAEFNDKQLALQDKKEFSKDNFIVAGPNAKFTVNAAGFVSENKDKYQAAEGEKFHAYTFTSSLPQAGGNNTATIPKISVEVDGKTVDIKGQMFSGGTLIVSAPENAKVILDIEVAGVKQSMDLNSGARTSQGIGDVWYDHSKGEISDGIISHPVQLTGNTVTLKAEFMDPMITAYDPRPELGWAENGKKAWVILSYTAPEWDVPGNAAPKNQKATLALVDSKGESYKPTTLKDSTGDTKLAFLVPSTETNFSIHTENSADIDDFGKTVASTGNVVLDQPKITFKK